MFLIQICFSHSISLIGIQNYTNMWSWISTTFCSGWNWMVEQLLLLAYMKLNESCGLWNWMFLFDQWMPNWWSWITLLTVECWFKRAFNRSVKINRFLLKLAGETYTTFVIASTMSTFSETYWCNIVTVKLFENITPNSPIKAHRLNNTHCTSLVSFKKCLLFLFYKVL